MNLPLPLTYRRLLHMFEQLDFSLNLNKTQGRATTFSELKKGIQISTKREFTFDVFAQILEVAPKMYNHHWEYRKHQNELMIDIPKNIVDILEFPITTYQSPEEYETSLKSELLQKRKDFFRDSLLSKVYVQYQIALSD